MLSDTAQEDSPDRGISLAGRLFGYSVAHQEASAEIAADGAAALMRSRAYLIRLAPDSNSTSTRPLPGY
jgi:hypothetical protein